jgi:hypothetical protein
VLSSLIFPLIFVWVLSLVFIWDYCLFWKIYLVFPILCNSKRPITNYNLSDEVTWEYLTKISGSYDLWWSLHLWDSIEKTISGNKISSVEFRNIAYCFRRCTFLFKKKDVNNIENTLLAKIDSFQGEMIN